MIGGGGKTGLMVYLLDELWNAGLQVVASTTTKLSADYSRGLSFRVVNSLSAVLEQVNKPRFPGERVTLVLGEAENEPGKMAGISSDWIDKAAAAYPNIIFLVEGDGSAGRSLKGHLTHEPVIPETTGMVIPVIGIDCIGKALDAESAHRPTRITELTGAKHGAIITGELITQLLFHPEGYLRNCPVGSSVLPFINKVESAAERQLAEELAQQILARQDTAIAGVMIGSVQDKDFSFIARQRFPVAGVILAAGGSSRMGTPKPLLPLGGEALIRHIVRAAGSSNLRDLLVVTGACAPQVTVAMSGFPGKLVHNAEWPEGQAGSVKVAVEALAPDIRAVIFLLADQPFIDAALINQLIETYEKTGAKIVAPRFQGRRGNPVLFDLQAWQEEFAMLTGDEGARRILRDHSENIVYVEISDQMIFQDVDTPEDYATVQQIWQARQVT